MTNTKSCGVIVMRAQPQLSFLVLQKSHRYDLPKGHIERGEDELSCALRELYEETAIDTKALELDLAFRFTITYENHFKRWGGEKSEKTVVIFLGWLKYEVRVKLSEHTSFAWIEWNPPHVIQKKTIDPLLNELARYFQEDRTRLRR